MNSNTFEEKSWLKQHWKWFIPITASIIISIGIFLSSGMGTHIAHFAKAYTDTALYEGALQKARVNEKVNKLIGDITPINKLSLIEGEVRYSNNNSSVDLSIKIKGSKRRATMDVSAEKIRGQWNYKKINIRIKKPIEDKQTIKVIQSLK